MLSHQLADVLRNIAGRSGDTTLFFDTLANLAKVSISFLEAANSNVQAPQNLNIQAQIRNGVRAATREVDLWALYESCKSFISGLQRAEQALGHDQEIVAYLRKEVRAFLDHYQRFIAVQDYATAFDLLLISSELYPRLEGVGFVADLAASNLSLPSGLSEFELEIASKDNLSDPADLAEVLLAISDIYREVSALIADAQLAIEPLTLVKIESGSLYLRLKGAFKTIRAMDSILKRAFKYGMENHTLSGRLDLLPKAADGVERILRIRDALAANGVDVSRLDLDIEGAAMRLARHANTLITKMEDIGINGEVFEVREQLMLPDAEEGSGLKLLPPVVE